MLFYQVGEWFQSYAVGKSRRNISELMDIRPDYAHLEVDGQLQTVDPDEIEIGFNDCSAAWGESTDRWHCPGRTVDLEYQCIDRRECA